MTPVRDSLVFGIVVVPLPFLFTFLGIPQKAGALMGRNIPKNVLRVEHRDKRRQTKDGVKRIPQATVVTLLGPEITDEHVMDEIGLQLRSLLLHEGFTEFVLSFTNISTMSSQFIGVLLRFLKKLREQGGTLVLCSLRMKHKTLFPPVVQAQFIFTDDVEQALKDHF